MASFKRDTLEGNIRRKIQSRNWRERKRVFEKRERRGLEKECKTMKSFKGDIPFQLLINLASHKFRLCRAENKYRIPFDISGNNQDLLCSVKSGDEYRQERYFER